MGTEVYMDLKDSDMLSTLPGVGDAEVTEAERVAAQTIGHGMFGSLDQHRGFPETGPEDEPSIPAAAGAYRIFEYTIPKKQQPYMAGDDAFTQQRLDALYERDCTGQLEGGGHSMVVAAGASTTGGGVENLNPLYPGEQVALLVVGGGFVSGDTPPAKWLYVRMARELGRRVFVPRYHVAPKHVYPRPLHDVYTALQHLEARGFRPCDVAVVAISAGAHVALGVLQLRALRGLPPVATCVAVAPCLDLAAGSDSWRRNQPVCVLPHVPPASPASLARMYLGPLVDPDALSGGLLRRPLLAPLHAPQAALPPLQIHAGEHDVLYDDAAALAARAGTELIAYAGCNHYTILRGRTQLDRLYGHMRRFVNKKVTCSR